MYSLIDRFFLKNQNTKKEVSWKDSFIREFYFQPEHEWITNDKKAKEAFNTVWGKLPMNMFEYLHRQSICFIRSEDYRSKSKQHYSLKNTVVVFPEYEKLLKSQHAYRVAFVAHELAFILYELESEKKDPLMAEVEADKFVVDLGFENELEKFLLLMDESSEKRLRLTYLTLKVFGMS